MKKHFLAGLAVVLVICSCSLSSLNPFGGDEKKAENETGVNHYLWQASLDKLSFMPLATVDATITCPGVTCRANCRLNCAASFIASSE